MGEDSKEEGMNVYGGRWGRSGDHYKEKWMLKLDSVVWTEHFQLAESKKDILSIRQGSQAVRHLLYLKKNKWFSIIEKEIVWCSEARERWDEMRERDPLGLAVFSEEPSTINPRTQTENGLNYHFLKMGKCQIFWKYFTSVPEAVRLLQWELYWHSWRAPDVKRKCSIGIKMREEVRDNLESEATCL